MKTIYLKPRRHRDGWNRARRRFLTEWVTAVSLQDIQRLINTATLWRRHPAPFNKHDGGRARREERRFAIARKQDALRGDIQC
jgi:hypothetical protein